MNQVSGNEPGLLLDYPLDEGVGNTAFDRTANHYNGTLTSTVAGDQPAWVADPGPGSGRVVAAFTSANPSATAANFTAQITWGDGHTSAGTITPNGQGGFNVTGANIYAQPGPYPITVVVTDGFNSMGTGQGTANVLAPVTHFVVTGFPSSIVAGRASTFTITAQDDLGRTFAGYRGTVHFSSSDPQAALPADYTFTAADNGREVFGAALFTAGIQSITATDTQTSNITGAQAGIVVRAAAAQSLQVTGFPSPTASGAPGSFTVTAYDRYGNPGAVYTGTVRFTSSDTQATLPDDYTFTSGDQGMHTFSASLVSIGTQSITVTDTSNPSLTATQSGIVVVPIFVVSGYPSPTTAGDAGTFTVTVEDANGNVDTAYTGTVHFSSSDGQADLPADYMFTAADQGVHAFGAVLKTAGTQSITATDTGISLTTGSQTGIQVNPSNVAGFFVVSGFPSPIQAGTAGSFMVMVYDRFGNLATGYTGTIHFTSTDPQASLPDDYTFTGSEGGMQMFMATLYTAGAHSLTVTDTSSGANGAQDGIQVTPSIAVRLLVFGYPSPVTAGTVNTFTVTAVDAYGNTGAIYMGTVHFSSSDPAANLPDDYMFTTADNGTHVFAAVFNTPGSQSLTATDTDDPSITGTQDGIEVVPGGGDGRGAPQRAVGDLSAALLQPLAPPAPAALSLPAPDVTPMASRAAVLAGAVVSTDTGRLQRFSANEGVEDRGSGLSRVRQGSRQGGQLAPADALGLISANWGPSLLYGPVVDDLAHARQG
jgi:hypothetical protein